jgi:hypothetical protein
MLRSLATVKKFKRKVRKVIRKEKPRKSAIISSIRVIRVLMLKSLASVKKFKRKVRKVLRKEKPRKSVIIRSIRVIRVLMLRSLAVVKKFKRKVRKVLRKEKQRESVNLYHKGHNESTRNTKSAIIRSICVIRVLMLKSLATVKKFKRKVRKVLCKESRRKSAIIRSIRVIRVLMLKSLATVKKFKRKVRKVLRKERQEICDIQLNPSYPRSKTKNYSTSTAN